MHSYSDKFKDRQPMETVEIIKKFYEDRGIITKVVINEKTEADTWFCRVELYYNNQIILGTNGKGVTEEFSLASGYAESYERFCNRINLFFSPLIMSKLMQVYMVNRGFRLDPDEKNITFEDMYAIPAVKDYYDHYLEDINLTKQYFDMITNGQIIGVPYESFNTPGQKAYYDPRIINQVIKSNGMCAGNSVSEALNQGISEICEMYCSCNIYRKIFDTYYEIDTDTIQNPIIQNILNKIKEAGLIVKLYDLSYNFNVPVVMSVLINPVLYNIHCNYGSFPVFDIAVERILTELYQGVESFYNMTGIQMPYRETESSMYLIDYLNSKTLATYLPEEILTKSKKVEYNKEVFLSNLNASNEEINEYFRDLCNKLHWNVWYYNNSLGKDMTSLSIFYDTFDCNVEKWEIFKYTGKTLKTAWFEDVQMYYMLNIYILQGKDKEAIELFDEICRRYSQNPPHGCFSGNLMSADWHNPYPCVIGDNQVLFKLLDIILNLNSVNYEEYADNSRDIFSADIRFYQLIRKYLNTKYYSKDEIKDFIECFGKRPTDEDFKLINDRHGLFKKVYIDNLRNIYFSQDYEKLLQCYLPE